MEWLFRLFFKYPALTFQQGDFVFAASRSTTIGLIVLVGAGMCVAALIALSKQDVRERLAYSCMAQALAVVMGGLLALPAGLFAAAGVSSDGFMESGVMGVFVGGGMKHPR